MYRLVTNWGEASHAEIFRLSVSILLSSNLSHEPASNKAMFHVTSRQRKRRFANVQRSGRMTKFGMREAFFSQLGVVGRWKSAPVLAKSTYTICWGWLYGGYHFLIVGFLLIVVVQTYLTRQDAN